MSNRANVTSLEALESFRASLVIYLSKARPTLEEVSSEVMRTRLWLQNEQRVHWENQVRRRTRVLEQAQETLFGAKLSNLREASTAEQVAVQRAKRALEEAESKLKLLKYWDREFDSRVGPMLKELDKLHTLLAHDMPLAAAHLAQVVKTLDAYAGIVAPSAVTETARPASAPGTEEGQGTSTPDAIHADESRSKHP